ncbi:MAG TPA: HlyD family efflux transporter periplasmic adaptor subunit, partial [Lacipirellulaceae bacterium]|nr:HlyD family efflux transporter periplasmic adaptor subunit [Lacipirellulaceae bacterium]
SGVDSAERRTELARRSEQLADQIALWGEPLESGPPIDPADDGADQHPPQLAGVLAQHLDHSHARMLAAVPVAFPRNAPPSAPPAPRTPHWDFVLIAERFHAGPPLRDALVELGELVAPALARTAALDRFPVRTLLSWTEGLAQLRRPARLLRIVAIPALLAGAVAALLFVPAEFVVEAPAQLAAAHERDIFATATGSVANVHVAHGQQVRRGDVLLVLADPELALQVQANRGEIAAARKRLTALAISRTDRSVPEHALNDRLPLAAEQRELEERLASLVREQALLHARSEALTLRSPRDGEVITPDVHTLLESRPVERGQSLLTIADSSAGWELHAKVPQRHIGHVIAARDAAAAALPVDFRLAGDVEASHPAHVIEISAAAPLDAAGLRDQAAPVEVRMAVDGAPPAAIRTGMSATVRIRCGQRSLGYVWLHDALATLYRWATF